METKNKTKHVKCSGRIACWLAGLEMFCLDVSFPLKLCLPGWCFVTWPPARWLPRPRHYLYCPAACSPVEMILFSNQKKQTSEQIKVWVIHLMACLRYTWEFGRSLFPLAHLLKVQFTSPKWQVLKIVVKIVSSGLEITFQNAKLNMGAGFCSSPLIFDMLWGIAELNSVGLQLAAGFLLQNC